MFGALIGGNDLYHEWYDRLNAHSFLDFMKRFVKILDKNKKYVFVLDNGPAHKARMSKEYLYSLREGIFIEFLPPYSPQLNCIETCWKTVRYNVTNSNFFQSLDGLKVGIEQFLNNHIFMLNPTNYLTR